MLRDSFNYSLSLRIIFLSLTTLFCFSILIFKFNQIASVVFFLLAYYIFLTKRIINDNKLFYSLILIVLVHQIALIFNVFIKPLPGASGDAIAFSEHAVLILEKNNFTLTYGSALYENLIAVLYKFFGQSYLMLSELVLLCFSYSCLAFIRLLERLNINNKHIPLLFYGLLPSSVIHLSIPLREVFELTFLIITFNCLYDFISSKKIRYLFKAVLPIIFLALIHKAMIILLFGLLCFFIFIFLKDSLNLNKYLLYLSTIIVFLWSLKFTNYFDQGFIQTIIDFRNSTDFGDMTYIANINNSLLGLFFGFSSIYIHYMMGPFIWDSRNIFDLVASFESLLRIYILLRMLYFYFNKNIIYSFKKELSILLGLYFIITIFWSLGTTNYGTAVRHHVLDWWIICIFIGYLNNLKNLKKNYD